MGGVGAKYVGPPLPKMSEGETVDLWGMRYRAIKYETGVYNEQYHWPLAAAKTIDALERYAWPSRPFDFAQGAVSLVEPRILPYGTPEDVRADVRDAIDTLASDGTGYRRRGSLARALLAPCHNLQAVTPIGNIIVMYDEAFRYGVF